MFVRGVPFKFRSPLEKHPCTSAPPALELRSSRRVRSEHSESLPLQRLQVVEAQKDSNSVSEPLGVGCTAHCILHALLWTLLRVILFMLVSTEGSEAVWDSGFLGF